MVTWPVGEDGEAAGLGDSAIVNVTAKGVTVAGIATVAVNVGKIVFDVVTEGITVTVG